tara:strand:- start:195 stop:542 length:348 start_codon:yes stop_codon:yes gene_type:complete
MESKNNINKTNDNVKIDIKEDKIVKKESGVYHNGKKLLYEKDEEFEIKSCCGSMCSIEKPYLEFIAKFIISTAVLSFSMFQLAMGNGDTSYFASTISLILGIYINNTDDNKERKK